MGCPARHRDGLLSLKKSMRRAKDMPLEMEPSHDDTTLACGRPSCGRHPRFTTRHTRGPGGPGSGTQRIDARRPGRARRHRLQLRHRARARRSAICSCRGAASTCASWTSPRRSIRRPCTSDRSPSRRASSVLEQNYEYDLLEPDKLLRKYVGRDVDAGAPAAGGRRDRRGRGEGASSQLQQRARSGGSATRS